MASIKFYSRSTKKQSFSLYLSLSDNKNNVRLRCVTPIVVNRDDWEVKKDRDNKNISQSLKKVTNGTIERKEARRTAKKQIEDLEAKVLDAYLRDSEKNEVIDTNWLKAVVSGSKGKKDETFLYWISRYIDKLPYKYIEQRKRTGASEGTIARYKTLYSNIQEYEKYQKKRYKIKDIGMQWAEDYQRYLYEIKGLSDYTVGRYIKFVKTICYYARDKDIPVNRKLHKITGFVGQTTIQYLSLKEIEKISQTPMPTEGLKNAKQWLIISCFIGQRVSDLMKLTKDNISKEGGYKYIELVQEKTGKEVAVPIRQEVQKILDENKGNFPKAISQQKYNKHIKRVAEIAGITQIVEGTRRNPETNRKETGKFRKCDLISSHVGRRSFVSNYYGKIETPLLMNVTGHSSERQLIAYSGLKPKDKAKELAEKWQEQERRTLKPLRGGKSAVNQ